MLLKLIKEEADVSFLLQQGLTFSQISLLFGEALSSGLIARNESTFNVTENGNEFLLKNDPKNHFGASGNWVFPDESFLITQISKDEVYLPKLKDSKFLGR